MSDPGGDQTTPMDVEIVKQEPAVIEKPKEPIEAAKSKSTKETGKSKSPMQTEKSKLYRQKEELTVPEIKVDSKKKMLRQVEYYFSDSNLHRDTFLKDTMKENDGWIPIKKLLEFPRVKQLVDKVERLIPGINSVELFVESLRSSKELLRVSDDGERVQRGIPLLDPKVIAERTVAVFGFPTSREFNVEEQKMFWGQFGGVLSVQRYVPNKGRSLRCVVFVEFDSKEIAKEVLMSEMLDYDGIEITVKEREPPNSRKRKREKREEESKYRPDKLLKISEYPEGTKWFEVKRWLEDNDVKDFFVHHKDAHSFVRLKGELSATEIAKKLENKPWSSEDERITKVEAIEDGGETWKTLIKSSMRRKDKRHRRGGPKRFERKTDEVSTNDAANHLKTPEKIKNDTDDATKMEEDL